MGSGLNFRSRPLDIDRSLPIYEEFELPDLFDACLVNRTVTKVPTGMEKDEESELDLQKALIAQKNNQKCTKALIPVPEVFLSEIDYNPKRVDIPLAYIGEELVSAIDEISNYDMDGADFKFVIYFTTYMDHFHDSSLFSYDEFESMMELMETTYKSTKSMERVMELIDKKHINKYVFQHWEKKRKLLKPYHMIVPCVRTYDKSSQNDPFVAFRKRVEKMQTRKNRKLDEGRYTNAFRIAHSLFSATDILAEIDQRERRKRNIENNFIQLYYKRYNRFRSENNIIENVLVENTAKTTEMTFKSYGGRKSIYNAFSKNTRRVSKNIFWRELWKSTRCAKHCINININNNNNKNIKSFCNNLVKIETVPLYAVQRPKSRATKFMEKFASYQREPPVYLLPLRERSLFECQSRDEFIRKFYFVTRVKETFAPTPTNPDFLPVTISAEVEPPLDSTETLEGDIKKETVEAFNTTHVTYKNVYMTDDDDALQSDHFKIDEQELLKKSCTFPTVVPQPFTNFSVNASSDNENDCKSPYLFDSNSYVFSSFSNLNDSDEAMTNLPACLVSTQTQNRHENGENNANFPYVTKTSTDLSPKKLYFVDKTRLSATNDSHFPRMESLEDVAVVDDTSHISSYQNGDDS